jgi:predicted subunit of tRNA(5-methylaminomethyl-2-thiouridylate) methyltransferase
MKAGVLFSGGKDSAMAAIMLSRDYDVELNTFVFHPDRLIPAIDLAAESLGFPLFKRTFGTEFLNDVVDMLVDNGYPNDAVNLVHRRAIHELCQYYDVVGDGTRQNDRVPMLTLGEVQSLAARYGCSYVRPLLGFGKTEVERLVARHLVVKYGETGELKNGDYENEIREILNKRGIDPLTIFPSRHLQSLVVSVRRYLKFGDNI